MICNQFISNTFTNIEKRQIYGHSTPLILSEQCTTPWCPGKNTVNSVMNGVQRPKQAGN